MMPSPVLISREQWEAREPKNITPLVFSEQRGTVLHYSGAASDAKFDHQVCDDTIRAIQNFHMDVRGWADIAYSSLCCIHGGVFTGRGRGVRTAANGTTAGNDAYHAVCFLGGDVAGRADVTEEGKTALRYAIESCNQWANVSRVVSHSFLKATACPGDELRAWLAAGMPTVEDTVSQREVIEALQSPEGQRELERAVDHLMSLGLTGSREGAIRAWAIKLENVEANVEKILRLLEPPVQ